MVSSVLMDLRFSYRNISIIKSQAYSQYHKNQFFSFPVTTNHYYSSHSIKLSAAGILLKPTATLEEKVPKSTNTALTDDDLLQEKESGGDETKGVEESVKLLKKAAKTRKVKKEEVLAALAVIKKKANDKDIDPSTFLDTLGGTKSPGRTWMLIFTSKDRLKRGNYFPITAVQRFDAAARRIENGVYLGPIGCLTFEGRFSWKKKILAFNFELLKIKIGPFGPLKISLGQKDDTEPSTKDPFFIWFYVDEEIAVAQGRGGGTAFWCRCRRVTP